ncbi:MAG: type II secretion system protein GspK [Gammaproteobacteria bacterium]|nr:type II secretion system protein GspK [Gammaproteobacteria bacterium]
MKRLAKGLTVRLARPVLHARASGVPQGAVVNTISPAQTGSLRVSGALRRLGVPPRSSALRRRSSAAGGFILVVTLWVLASLTLLAAYIDGVTSADVDRMLRARQALARELDRRGTEATVIYLLATGRMGYRGLIVEQEQRFANDLPDGVPLPGSGDGEIPVTDEVYAGLGDTFFSVQDELGLASVNSPLSPVFRAVLEGVGIPRSNVDLIVARMADYVDVDGTLSLNGAERFEYESRGLYPPPNWIMASPLEARRVLGVGELIAPAQWRRLAPILSTRQTSGYNFNVMAPAVLSAVVGLPESAILPVVEARRVRPIRSLSRLAMLTGVHLDLDDLLVVSQPSEYMRVSTWNAVAGAMHRTGIQLTAFGERAPWRTDYAYTERVSAVLALVPVREQKRNGRNRSAVPKHESYDLPAAPSPLLDVHEPVFGPSSRT